MTESTENCHQAGKKRKRVATLATSTVFFVLNCEINLVLLTLEGEQVFFFKLNSRCYHSKTEKI